MLQKLEGEELDICTGDYSLVDTDRYDYYLVAGTFYTSFTFSPFYSLGGVSGNGWSLVICFVPRILVGIIPYFLFRGLKKLIKSDTVPLAVCGFIGSMVNTLLVMNLIYVFFGDSWGSAKGVAGDLIYKAILAVIATNGIPEAIVAALITAAVGKALLKLGAR